VISTTPLIDSIQQTFPAAGETRNNTLDKGVLFPVTEEEEVASKTSKEMIHPIREEDVAERRSKGSSHYDRKEEFVEIFLSPRDRGSTIKESQTPVIRTLLAEPTKIPGVYWRIFMAPTTSTIDFPIGDLGTGAPTKSIPLTTLPSFHGLTSEDPDTFLFEFDIVRWGYDYIMDAQKLKIFPATLKGIALWWFMGLRGRTITTWEEMKTTFLEKYQDYCKS